MSNTYHRIIRKLVVGFGNVFNNITLTRYNTDGSEDRRVKVPIIYSPKEKYVARLVGDPELNKKVQVTLPRMSFDLVSMEYDSTRKQVTNSKNYAPSGNPSTKLAQYNPVPYNFNFSLYIYVRNIEDGTQIVEHILPYFTPDYTVKLNLVPSMGITKEVPILLNKVDYHIDYEGVQDSDARIIIWTLDFTAKGFVYGPVTSGSIIRQSLVSISQLAGVLKTDNVTFDLADGGFGLYKDGETVYQGFSLDTATASGTVVSYSITTNKLLVTNINGAFQSESTVVGFDSQAEYTINSFEYTQQNISLIDVTPNPANSSSSNVFSFNTVITEAPFAGTNTAMDNNILDFSNDNLTMDSN